MPGIGPITASLGVATFPQHASSRELLVTTADRALYQAKRTGRNRVCSPLDLPDYSFEETTTEAATETETEIETEMSDSLINAEVGDALTSEVPAAPEILETQEALTPPNM
jgi:predicted signal transduction protein with EAL and GGDEF domain